MSVVIKVENLSKYYRLGVIGGGTLREDLGRWWAMRRGNPDPLLIIGEADHGNRKDGQIWALRDVSFEVQEGEILGIIGRNGAGKSTLLKILSRITAPTAGRAKIKGRVASLLEVGTGFHPQLTGRENIYLNGTILGMSRREVGSKFEEIVEFAEVREFIDTPVKRYSSGMTVRLAFAVAAHLEPEILIVDEVLAVGDAKFQKKCLGKMEEVSGQGRTVLFVSHNMGMITSLCRSAILLENGRLAGNGSASAMVSRYLSQGVSAPFDVDFSRQPKVIGDHIATLLSAKIVDKDGHSVGEVDIRKPVWVQMRYKLLVPVPKAPYANFHFLDSAGKYAFVSAGENYMDCDGMVPGIYTARCHVPANLLNSETYFVGVALTFTHSGLHVSFFEKDALCLSVVDPLAETVDDERCGYAGPMPGVVRPALEWQIRKES